MRIETGNHAAASPLTPAEALTADAEEAVRIVTGNHAVVVALPLTHEEEKAFVGRAGRMLPGGAPARLASRVTVEGGNLLASWTLLGEGGAYAGTIHRYYRRRK